METQEIISKLPTRVPTIPSPIMQNMSQTDTPMSAADVFEVTKCLKKKVPSKIYLQKSQTRQMFDLLCKRQNAGQCLTTGVELGLSLVISDFSRVNVATAGQLVNPSDIYLNERRPLITSLVPLCECLCVRACVRMSAL